MGEIANDMINGSSCFWCGVYFEREHGYPVVCKNCWKNSTKEEREGSMVQKAIEKEL